MANLRFTSSYIWRPCWFSICVGRCEYFTILFEILTVENVGLSLFLFFPLSGVRCCLQLFAPPHLLALSTLLCLLSSCSSLPPLLPSSHLSLHSPPISTLASPVSPCPALVIMPLSSVVCHPPSFLRVQPTVLCS